MTIKQFLKGLRAALVAFTSKKEEVPRHWYLFRSPEVAEICAHLTPEEDVDFASMGRNHGFTFGIAISIPTLVFAMLVTGRGFWHFLPIQIVLQIAIAVIVQGWMRDRHKAFFASTKYAKSRGLNAASIRYYDSKTA